MWPFKKKVCLPYNGLPEWDVVPIIHGRWALRKRNYWPSIGFYYMEAVTEYDTKTQALKDVKHLGLKL